MQLLTQNFVFLATNRRCIEMDVTVRSSQYCSLGQSTVRIFCIWREALNLFVEKIIAKCSQRSREFYLWGMLEDGVFVGGLHTAGRIQGTCSMNYFKTFPNKCFIENFKTCVNHMLSMSVFCDLTSE